MTDLEVHPTVQVFGRYVGRTSESVQFPVGPDDDGGAERQADLKSALRSRCSAGP